MSKQNNNKCPAGASKSALIGRLNELGEEVGIARKNKDKYAEQKLTIEVFEIVNKIYGGVPNSQYTRIEDDSFAALMGEFFLKRWKNFDPEKGNLYGFISGNLEFVKKDVSNEMEHRWHGNKPGNKKYWPSIYETKKGDTKEFGEKLPGKESDEPEKRYAESEDATLTMARLLESVLKMEEHLHNRKSNKCHIFYSRLFFTDNIATICKKCANDLHLYFPHERDAFEILEETFLDFFMSMECRTFDAIAITKLKSKKDLEDVESDEEETLPLPDKVFVNYFKQILNEPKGVSAISNHRTPYMDYIRSSIKNN